MAIKHGVQINLGDIKYGNDDFHAKLTVKNSEVNGVEIACYFRFLSFENIHSVEQWPTIFRHRTTNHKKKPQTQKCIQ